MKKIGQGIYSTEKGEAYNVKDPGIAEGFTKVSTDERKSEAKEAATIYSDARKQLNEGFIEFGNLTKLVAEHNTKFLIQLRDQRMSIVAELSQINTSLRDLRKFFLDDAHEEEIKRLNEFVSLCERLKKLKDEGFLDAVADTMLKISGV